MLEALLAEFEYDALETCAADGTCLLACPVGIDTGKFVKGCAREQHSERAEQVALRLAGPLGGGRAGRAGEPARRPPRPGGAGGDPRRQPRDPGRR